MPSRVIEYRAVVDNVTVDGHPIQAISHSMNDIIDWSRIQCNHYNKTVKIFVQREYRLKLIRPKMPKKVTKKV